MFGSARTASRQTPNLTLREMAFRSRIALRASGMTRVLGYRGRPYPTPSLTALSRA